MCNNPNCDICNACECDECNKELFCTVFGYDKPGDHVPVPLTVGAEYTCCNTVVDPNKIN
jgi:hypothetical protein